MGSLTTAGPSGDGSIIRGPKRARLRSGHGDLEDDIGQAEHRADSDDQDDRGSDGNNVRCTIIYGLQTDVNHLG